MFADKILNGHWSHFALIQEGICSQLPCWIGQNLSCERILSVQPKQVQRSPNCGGQCIHSFSTLLKINGNVVSSPPVLTPKKFAPPHCKWMVNGSCLVGTTVCWAGQPDSPVFCLGSLRGNGCGGAEPLPERKIIYSHALCQKLYFKTKRAPDKNRSKITSSL